MLCACCLLHAQIAHKHRHDRRLPTYKLLEAISRVLDYCQQFPDLQLAPLLQPVIAAARTRYSLDALVPKVRRMRRVLPDTQLREALMCRGGYARGGACLWAFGVNAAQRDALWNLQGNAEVLLLLCLCAAAWLWQVGVGCVLGGGWPTHNSGRP